MQSTKNVDVKERIPQSQVETEEAKINIEICILNKVSAQIPGKLFYHTNTAKPIIVITDGPRATRMREELERSNRFIFCENNEEAIRSTILSVMNNSIEVSQEGRGYYSPYRICKQIIS